MTEELKYSKTEIVDVLRHINDLVVSLDRLGSANHDLPEDVWKTAVLEYFLESKALKALPDCRRILSEPFSTELGEDDMDELEREMEDIKFWSFKEFCSKHNV